MKKAQKPKKKIDLTADTDGRAVAPVKEKERKLDITDECRNFLKSPIDFKSIKRMILRFEGPISDELVNKAEMHVYALCDRHYQGIAMYDFIITIFHKKLLRKYFLTNADFISLCWFFSKKTDNSLLKQRVRHELFNYFCNHLNECILINFK
jgi:hypothetical protein